MVAACLFIRIQCAPLHQITRQSVGCTLRSGIIMSLVIMSLESRLYSTETMVTGVCI